MKKYCLAILLPLLAACSGTTHYYKGADIGWATEYQARGDKFYNKQGE